ncbi:MAG: PorV/PorQ family protein [Dysgonamonadaceae bacterium]|nr:PorV/PorQ family protein [Dysgonamonadaceae bacterium]
MKKTLIAPLLLMTVAATIVAQTDIEPINAGAANFLTLPSNARILGMGGANVALTDGNLVFYNGAGLLFGDDTDKSGIAYNYTSWLRDFDAGYNFHALSGFHKINATNAVYGGFRRYGYPKQTVINEGASNDEYIYPSEWAVDLGYSRKVLEKLALSASFRLVRSDMGQVGGAKSANAVALDFGALYSDQLPSIQGAKWAVGLRFNNFGTKLKYLTEQEDLPTMGQIGGSLHLPCKPKHRITVAADIGYRLAPSEAQSLSLNSGVEYSFSNILMLRGGYRHGDKNKGERNYTTAGAGISYRKIHFDLAWLFAEKEALINNSFNLSCGVEF